MFQWFGIGKNSMQNDEAISEQESYDIGDSGEIGQISVDIIESETQMCIVAPVAGIELEDIDVSIDDCVLTISGRRQRPASMYHEPGRNIKHSECFWGRFKRDIILPESLDFESIKATMENSLLCIQLSKLNFSKKHIEIESLDE